MSIANSQSLDIELPVLNSSSRLAPSDSSLDHGLQLPNQSDDNPTLRADRTLNLIDPPLPAYTPSAPATPIRPGASARALELDDELLRYTLTHDRGGVPVSRLPESFPTDDGQSFRSRETLPPYGANDPPIYRRRIVNSEGEPKTLAMLFFKFGFFFPPFWVFGALMLITPLRSPNPLSPLAASSAWPPNTELIAWCNENIHTEADKLAFLARMQEVEMKWARRCLIALSMVICFSVAIAATIVGVLKVT